MSSLVATLREDTQHRIHVSEIGAMCGLVPLGAPAEKTFSSGFRWNLEGQTLTIPDFISTSNETVKRLVSVRSAGALLFTLTLASQPAWRNFVTWLLSV